MSSAVYWVTIWAASNILLLILLCMCVCMCGYVMGHVLLYILLVVRALSHCMPFPLFFV